MIPGNGEANEARAEAIRLQAKTQRLEVILVVLAGLAVVVAGGSATYVGLQTKKQQDRIEDCTNPDGRCYKQTQAQTAAAVQTILDYIKATIDPHRLRNEAENKCQVELFARKPTILNSGAESALEEYDACVLRRSGGTEPPPLPKNPLTATTTTEPPP